MTTTPPRSFNGSNDQEPPDPALASILDPAPDVVDGAVLRTTRRALKVLAFLSACAVGGGVAMGSRTLAATGAIALAAASALLILTRVERAHRSVARRVRVAVDIEPSAAWRAGARASIRIGLAIALIAVTIAAAAAGEVLVSAAVAGVACAIAVFGGATWLAVVGEEEERARRAIARSRAPRP